MTSPVKKKTDIFSVAVINRGATQIMAITIT